MLKKVDREKLWHAKDTVSVAHGHLALRIFCTEEPSRDVYGDVISNPNGRALSLGEFDKTRAAFKPDDRRYAERVTETS